MTNPNLIADTDLFFNQFEPKLKNRFILAMDGVPAFMIKQAKRPSLETETVTLAHINVERYVKGKTKWKAMDFTLYDPVVPSGAQAVMEWVRLHHESVTGRDGYADFYKKDLTLKILGPVGDVVEEWKLVGCFITSADFGDMAWAGTSEPLEVKVTIQPDYCILLY